MEAGWTRAKDTTYVVWWSWELALYLATPWIFLKCFPEFNSMAVLCIWHAIYKAIVYTAACLLPVGVFTARVYLQCLGPDCLYWWDEPSWRLASFISIQIHTHTHSSYYQVWYVESNWSELILVVTASGGITDCESVTIHHKKKLFWERLVLHVLQAGSSARKFYMIDP